MEIISGLPTTLVDESGHVYSSLTSLAKMLGVDRKRLSKSLKRDGKFTSHGHTYRLAPQNVNTFKGTDVYTYMDGSNENTKTIVKEVFVDKPREDEAEYQEFKKVKEVEQLPFSKFKFNFSKGHQKGHRYAVALFSDAHIEETVYAQAVLNYNEYNIEIAKQRIEKYFVNLVNCLNEDMVDDLIFASLGDTISGYIHDELAQENGMSPLEATFVAQNLIYSGLEYICNHSNVKHIKFIGIVGNHSRVTKRIQHANGFKMSYEWLMYKNIEKEAMLAKLPIEFCLPESELALVEADSHRFIFAHGYQIKGGGTSTVCGIYPALNRLCLKWEKVFHQDHLFIGHFHSCISIPNATVNGSIIGYNAYALSNGMGFEVPAQSYVVYDSELGGELLTRKIYCK